MEKSYTPTSKHSVFCDHYDAVGSAKLHKAKGKQKLELTLKDLEGDDAKSLSLFAADARLLGESIVKLAELCDER